jgi:hypothetical protein
MAAGRPPPATYQLTGGESSELTSSLQSTGRRPWNILGDLPCPASWEMVTEVLTRRQLNPISGLLLALRQARESLQHITDRHSNGTNHPVCRSKPRSTVAAITCHLPPLAARGSWGRRMLVLAPQCAKDAKPEAESSPEGGTGGHGGLGRRDTPSGDTYCRLVTANPTDKRRTDDQGPTAATCDQALDLLLHL